MKLTKKQLKKIHKLTLQRSNAGLFVVKAIKRCKTEKHLIGARKLICNFKMLYGDEESLDIAYYVKSALIDYKKRKDAEKSTNYRS